MTGDEKQKQAEVLALIAKLPKDATIEDFLRQRFSANVIVPDKQKTH